MTETFTYRTRVWFEELDAMRILHNSRYAIHVEHAMTALFDSFGFPFAQRLEDNPDQFHAVREFHIEFLSPFRGPGELIVELWREHLGMTSATYGFRIIHADSERVAAQGRRSIVKLDPVTFAPAPWTDEFLDANAALAVRELREPDPALTGQAA